jgi:hypothetical protein
MTGVVLDAVKWAANNTETIMKAVDFVKDQFS